MLSYILKGRREQVITYVGRADIVIKEDGMEFVIEVKKASEFLHAIGQVVGYASALTKEGENIERIRIIALFNWYGLPAERIEECRRICADVNVHVWFIDENLLQFMYDIERNRAENMRDVKPANYFLEQFTYLPLMDERRAEFHARMKRGEIGTDDIVFASSDDEEDEEEEKDEEDAEQPDPPDSIRIRKSMKRLKLV
jgi:hypothetical protein